MNPVHQWFLRISRREKTLFLVTLLVLVLWGFSSYSKKSTVLENQRMDLSGGLQEQNFWIGRKESIASETQELLARLDRSRMMNAEALAAWVDATARRTGSAFSVVPGATINRQGLNRHSLRLSLERIPMDRLIQLVLDIERNNPYLLLDEISIDPVSGTPNILNVRVRITSLETVQP
jgi:hypothetical protein